MAQHYIIIPKSTYRDLRRMLLEKGLAKDDYSMRESTKASRAKLLSLMSINDVDDFDEAFGLVVSALATICRALNDADLKTVVSNIEFPHAKALASLSSSEFASLSRLVEARQETLCEGEIYNGQMMVQRLISPPRRKRLAAYYTKPIGLELMARLVANSISTQKHPVVLADPFLGSGLTITTTLKRLDASMVRKVWGVESHPLPALIAYSAILYVLRGDHSKMEVAVGDAFRNAYVDPSGHRASIGQVKEKATPRADIIIANPPFTRWELLEDDYRNLLWDLTENLGYSKYVSRRQLNLQVASLFLMDHMLKEGGLLISVLPASTFYTLYGEAIKSILEEKYEVNGFVESESDTSFSIDSGLREVILFATKRKSEKRHRTAFATIKSNTPERIWQVVATLEGSGSEEDGTTWVDLAQKSILAEANWSVFFADSKLREALSRILSKGTENGTIATWSAIYGSQSIIRGVEMYGPDFFFIPNRHWRIAEELTRTVTIENSKDQIRLGISREYLVPALRKPGLYLDAVEPDVNHYLLSIPPVPVRQLDEGPAEYIAWGRRNLAAQPAIRAFGDHWYSHVNKQIRVKKPFGRVFLPDKIDPTFRNRGFFASHSQEPLVASKNFHIVSLNDDSRDKMLTLWFNGALFFSYFIVVGRRITKSWSRLLEDNYLKMPVIDLNSISKRDVMELEKVFESLLKERLPPLKQQLTMEYRRQIDRTLLQIIGVDSAEEDLKRIYSALGPNLR